jgi:hypothetical protein
MKHRFSATMKNFFFLRLFSLVQIELKACRATASEKRVIEMGGMLSGRLLAKIV